MIELSNGDWIDTGRVVAITVNNGKEVRHVSTDWITTTNPGVVVHYMELFNGRGASVFSDCKSIDEARGLAAEIASKVNQILIDQQSRRPFL